MKINTDDEFLFFVRWLIDVKRYDADSILRVLEKPHHTIGLQEKFKEEIQKGLY